MIMKENIKEQYRSMICNPGDIILHDKTRYVAVLRKGSPVCGNCALKDKKCGLYACSHNTRNDGKDIMFLELK